MVVRLNWLNRTQNADEQRIYRSASAFDASNLPSVLATVSAGASEYEDQSAATGTRYWYAVAAVSGGALAVSDLVEIQTAYDGILLSLSGDEQSGTDFILLSGAAQTGGDGLRLSGDES